MCTEDIYNFDIKKNSTILLFEKKKDFDSKLNRQKISRDISTTNLRSEQYIPPLSKQLSNTNKGQHKSSPSTP